MNKGGALFWVFDEIPFNLHILDRVGFGWENERERERDSWKDWRRMFHRKGGGSNEDGGAFMSNTNRQRNEN